MLDIELLVENQLTYCQVYSKLIFSKREIAILGFDWN